MKVILLFPIVQRDPRWENCSVCGERADYIGVYVRDQESGESNLPVCGSCASANNPECEIAA